MSRKKRVRLPNGFGSIVELSGKRRNAFAVYPPARLTEDLSVYKRPKAICYCDDWYVAFAVLNAYHAGTYQKGDELQFKQYKTIDKRSLDQFCLRILADYQQHTRSEALVKADEPTFKEVYDKFYEWKFGENAEKTLSKASKIAIKSAYDKCKAIHDKIFTQITHDDLQQQINASQTKSATKENIKNLFSQMYKYAELYGICEKNMARGLIVQNIDDDENGVPFTEQDLKTLWEHSDDPTVEFLLIMCYSGFRISAYMSMEVDLESESFTGGVKTRASIGRTVPIHPAILPLVQRRMMRDGSLLTCSARDFRIDMYQSLADLNIVKHTPHDCRHTFSMLCEKYGVPENDRKRMLGHSFSDVTNSVYGHRSLEDLRKSISLIQKP